MYFGNLNDEDLNFFHNKTFVNTVFNLNDILSSNLFYVEEHGDFVEVNPLFYYEKVSVSDENAIIRQNNILLKKDVNVEFVFQSKSMFKMIQVYGVHTETNWFVYLLNEWCKGINNIEFKVTETTPTVEPPEISDLNLTILNTDYEGKFEDYFTENLEYDLVTTQYNGATYIQIVNDIYIELTLNHKTYCFKLGVTE